MGEEEIEEEDSGDRCDSSGDAGVCVACVIAGVDDDADLEMDWGKDADSCAPLSDICSSGCDRSVGQSCIIVPVTCHHPNVNRAGWNPRTTIVVILSFSPHTHASYLFFLFFFFFALLTLYAFAACRYQPR